MAIIRPSIKFEGSELNLTASSTPYIKEGVRKAVFNKSTNQEGAYLYFLPGYAADASGNGVWYKRISVRTDFGINFKERYYIPNRAEDPAEYFAFNFRTLYPNEAKVTEQEVNGKKFKKYPNYGRVTDRVLYNVAFAQNLQAGAHVLDLPLRNGADILMNWLEGKDMHGNSRNPINDPDCCVPVFVKLKENSANPWMVQVENNSPVRLPEQLADSDYLYNLDDVLVQRSKEEIIAKLREMYSSDVFEDCMNGYPGFGGKKSSTQSQQFQPPVARSEPKAAPVATVPVLDIPKAAIDIPKAAIDIPRASITAPVAAVNPPPSIDMSALPQNPMSAGKLSREEALRFINQQ